MKYKLKLQKLLNSFYYALPLIKKPNFSFSLVANPPVVGTWQFYVSPASHNYYVFQKHMDAGYHVTKFWHLCISLTNLNRFD